MTPRSPVRSMRSRLVFTSTQVDDFLFFISRVVELVLQRSNGSAEPWRTSTRGAVGSSACQVFFSANSWSRARSTLPMILGGLLIVRKLERYFVLRPETRSEER